MTSDPIERKYVYPVNYGGKYPPDWESRRKKTLKIDDWTCQNCGAVGGPKAGNDGAELHVHHIKPLSEGGNNSLQNLETLCLDCHNDEHEHDITSSRTNTSSQDEGSDFVEWTANLFIQMFSGLFLFIFGFYIVKAIADLNGWAVGTVFLIALLIFTAYGAYKYPLPAILNCYIVLAILTTESARSTLTEMQVISLYAIFGTILVVGFSRYLYLGYIYFDGWFASQSVS